MAEITLTAEVGRETGSAATRRLRHEGKIPGVIYGHGADPVPVAVNARDLRLALSGESGLNQLLQLEAGGEHYLTLARELQRHPVRGTVTHIDFQVVGRDELVTAEVALSIIGDAVDVRHQDGAVDQQLFSILVSAKPGDIPVQLEVDITELKVGESIKVSDLALPAGATAVTDLDATVISAHVGRLAGKDEDEAEAPATEA